MNNEKADREFPPRLFTIKLELFDADPYACLWKERDSEKDFEYLSLEEHEALLESAINAETARCILICEEQKKEERAKVWEEAANTEVAFAGYSIEEIPQRIRNYFLEKAKEERENGSLFSNIPHESVRKCIEEICESEVRNKENI